MTDEQIREVKHCAMCRRLILPPNVDDDNHPITLVEKKDGKFLQLSFDKQECAIVFQRLRRFYGNDFFYEVVANS